MKGRIVEDFFYGMTASVSGMALNPDSEDLRLSSYPRTAISKLISARSPLMKHPSGYLRLKFLISQFCNHHAKFPEAGLIMQGAEMAIHFFSRPPLRIEGETISCLFLLGSVNNSMSSSCVVDETKGSQLWTKHPGCPQK